MNRRGFLLGMAGILATATAPAIVKAANIMPVHAPIPEAFGQYVYNDASGLWETVKNGSLEEVRQLIITFAVEVKNGVQGTASLRTWEGPNQSSGRILTAWK